MPMLHCVSNIRRLNDVLNDTGRLAVSVVWYISQLHYITYVAHTVSPELTSERSMLFLNMKLVPQAVKISVWPCVAHILLLLRFYVIRQIMIHTIQPAALKLDCHPMLLQLCDEIKTTTICDVGLRCLQKRYKTTGLLFRKLCSLYNSKRNCT